MRYAAAADPNQMISASSSPRWLSSPTHATCPSGRTSTASGAATLPDGGELPRVCRGLALMTLDAISPGYYVEAV